MRVYIAGYFTTRDRLRPIRDQLWKLGHEVVSTWLDEVKHPDSMDEETFFKKLALRDLAEIRSADLIIVDTFDVTERGGREVEFGFALGRFQGIETWIVGPMRNVFHRLADLVFDDWTQALEFLTPVPTEAVAMYDQSWLEREGNND